jgi:D-3-phosphoglycerate dehydrogenase
MTDTVDNLILDLVEWLERRERTYQETMEAWRTSCPRLPVWEDACERGFVVRVVTNNGLMVQATSGGLAFLEEKRPDAYEALRRRSGVQVTESSPMSAS